MKDFAKQLRFNIFFGLMLGIYASCYHHDPVDTSSIEEKITFLIDDMTLEEKIGQLVQYSGYEQLTGPGQKDSFTQIKHNRLKKGLVGSMLNVVSVEDTREAQTLVVENSRLGIPLLFGYDVIHGYKTMFPVPLAETASWDLEAVEASSRISAIESAAAGLHWTFAPMVDISRDARWGRIMEGCGEDTYLCSVISQARVNGFQGKDLSANNTIAACAKHFAAYGFAEAGRDYNSADISYHTLQNVVLPPFKACVDAGVATVMNSFNEIGGVPATADKHLQKEILKEDWGFEGFVISDWGSIAELINHGVAENKYQASLLAFSAGSDMDMEGYCYENSLDSLLSNNLIKLEQIDESVRRILRVKYALGIMDDPYKYCNEDREKLLTLSNENLGVARDVARKSIVLLKNEKKLLPLATDIRSIALIGPFAKDKDVPLGNWRAQAIANSAVSLYEGIENQISANTKLSYAKGTDHSIGQRAFHAEMTINKTSVDDIDNAVRVAKNSDVVILTLGEDCYQTGEGRSQTELTLSQAQLQLFDAVKKVNDNVIVVLMNGRPLVLTEFENNASTILETWHLGSESGNAIADIIFGKYNPSGKLPVCFPQNEGQLPLYYSQKPTGRGGAKPEVFWSHYTDISNKPLFPFGYGLSYSEFEYSEISLSNPTMNEGESIIAKITVKNTSDIPGDEVIQLYIHDVVGSISRPLKELKSFKKVFFKPQESKDIEFEITEEMLSFYTINNKWETESGNFELFIGTNSEDCKKIEFQFKN